jgi:hypothetical protein
MLWHFYGLQGSGKSVGLVIWSLDFHLKKKYKVYANFWLKFGNIISIKDLMNFKYNHCVVILDEAYGVADSHQTNKANDNISEVTHQSRKRDVEVFFSTQLDTDLYKRIRSSAHRKVLCENIGTEETPILTYTITNQRDRIINPLMLNGRRINNPAIFKTESVRKTYPLFNTDETIMPMHLNPEITKEKILGIFNDCTDKNTFYMLMREENPFFIKDACNAGYNLIKAGKIDRAMGLFKVSK